MLHLLAEDPKRSTMVVEPLDNKGCIVGCVCERVDCVLEVIGNNQIDLTKFE